VSKRRRIVRIAAATVVGCVVVAWLVVGLTLDGYRIPSEAMAPTLGADDRVLARSISGDDVSRGDVVIYLAPREPGVQQYERIARVVAVAGDAIGEDDEFLAVNGERVDEPWLPEGTTTFGIEEQVVPDDHVFVMGDNRANSEDSRIFGPVPHENILKLVVVQWWPPTDFGGP
jgi:signal peptidase I